MGRKESSKSSQRQHLSICMYVICKACVELSDMRRKKRGFFEFVRGTVLSVYDCIKDDDVVDVG